MSVYKAHNIRVISYVLYYLFVYEPSKFLNSHLCPMKPSVHLKHEKHIIYYHETGQIIYYII